MSQLTLRGAPQSLFLDSCNSNSSSQLWSVDGGHIGVIAPLQNEQSNCLCAPSSGGSGPLSLQQCEGEGSPLHPFEVGFNFSGSTVSPIPWFPDDKAPSSGLCVTGTAPKTAPQLQPCSGAATQLWKYQNSLLSTADDSLCFTYGLPPPPLVSTVFGSEMVFQRNANVDLWGVATPGGVVRVTLSGFAPVQTGVSLNGSWAVSLPPMPASTGYNITVLDLESGSMQVLVDVAFGDVIWCSGQSNLSGGNTPLRYAFNSTEEIAASSNYPWIRLFTVGTPPGSDTPLANLAHPPYIPWSKASPDSSQRFSATCWFTLKRLADTLGPAIPLGGVESAWGGTSIQVWLPPSSQSACGTQPSYPGGWPTELSACWNSQTVPFSYAGNSSVSMKISAIAWYQVSSPLIISLHFFFPKLNLTFSLTHPSGRVQCLSQQRAGRILQVRLALSCG